MLTETLACIIMGGTIMRQITHSKNTSTNYNMIAFGSVIGAAVSFYSYNIFKNNLKYVLPFNLQVEF